MSQHEYLFLFILMSCGCGVGLGFFLGVNVGLWHERRRAADTPPRPLKIAIHEHYPDGFGEAWEPDEHDLGPDGRDDESSDDYGTRLGPRNN